MKPKECPKCGCLEIGFIDKGDDGKPHPEIKWREYKCFSCKKSFTIKNNTEWYWNKKYSAIWAKGEKHQLQKPKEQRWI